MKELLPKGQRRLEIPANGKVQQDFIRVRRTLADLPLPAKQMNVLSAVCAYTLMGLSDRDIGEALSMDIERVGRVKMMDGYIQFYDNVVKSIIDEEASDVRSLFAANARKAAGNLVDLASDAENEGVRLKANQDILDRAGHRPADVVLVKGQLDTTLKVVYVEDESPGAVIDGEAIQTEEG